jgi:uncharacterized protein
VTRRRATGVALGKRGGNGRRKQNQQTPLMVACVAGHMALVRRLVASGHDVNFVNQEGETALTFAVVWNQEQVVRYLLAKGADTELPKKPDWSPLMYAAFEGDEQTVLALIRRGADLSRRDLHNRSAADLARTAGHEGCATLIESQIVGRAASKRSRSRRG